MTNNCPGTVTRIEAQARNPERVNVYLDDAFAFALNRLVAEAAGLHVGQPLDEKQIADLLQRETFQQALDRALNFLSYRPRSEQEVRQRLGQKGVAPDVVEAVLERLRKLGLVDDAAFASYWAANRSRFNPRGAVAIRTELRQKGVAPTVAAEAAQEIDEEAGAEAAARRRIPRLQGLDRATFRRRLGAYLTRRGFSYEIANRVVERMWQQIADGTIGDQDSVLDDEVDRDEPPGTEFCTDVKNSY